MAITLFSLPPEVRRQIYSFVFAEAHTVFDFGDHFDQKCSAPEVWYRPFAVSSKGDLNFLLVSKRCYADAIDSFHETRTVCVRNLGIAGINEFSAMTCALSKAKAVELEDFSVFDLSIFPSLPTLRRLVVNGISMWGGNMIVQRGQTALDAFSDSVALECLSLNVRYSCLKIEEGVSKFFPAAHIIVNFRIGNQVMDENMMRGVQDWDWACSYDVKNNKLEKRLAHRLVLW